jgi:MFS family permease
MIDGRRILYATAFLRAVSTGLVGVLLGVYLAKVGLSGESVGVVIAAGLVGATLSAVLATFWGDRIGRRRMLLGLSAFAVAGTVGVANVSEPLALAIFALIGMLNGMGKDRGAALILEQAALASLTKPHERTRAIAWYTMLQDLGHALGALLAGLPSLLEKRGPWEATEPHRLTFMVVAALGVAILLLYAFTRATLQESNTSVRATLSGRSRRILVRLSALFMVDGLAGGLLTTALLSFFFFERFGVDEGTVGLLFFCARVLNAASHLGAAWLARRIGLINTMVFTHMPSSLLLIAVAFVPSFGVAALLFLLREALVEMDVPTRQSYVLAVVAQEERTFASGITNLVRLASWAVGPVFAGFLLGTDGLHLPLVIGASMKIVYDLLLWRAFRRERPPEERIQAPA